jgi:hypothetical protein
MSGGDEQVALVFENWNGRDALARTLGFCPSLDDMRMYQAHLAHNCPGKGPVPQQLYRRARERDFLAFQPSVDPAPQSPEFEWPLRQQDGDLRAISIITGSLICKINTQTGEFEEQSGRLRAPFTTGDDHRSPALRAENGEAIASLLFRMNFAQRMEPDPDDVPKGPLDALPAGFFPADDGSTAFQSGQIAALHSDFCAEAGRDHLTDAFKCITSGCTDYRVWLARAFAAMGNEVSSEAEEEALTLLRCIGITRGMDNTRTLLAEIWAGFSALEPGDKLSQAPATLLQAMYGSTFFPSVFYNLEDLRPETLKVTGLVAAYPGLLWCQ